MMETFDRCRVSFVSVTQQFNTSTSMGRLMLNVLLSFAQFEREMISERTRDKIAATRRKGKWTGGCPMLGYDVVENGGRLRVNEDEAARVRGIFELYLDRQSLMTTSAELRTRGWTTKRWVSTRGRELGGRPLTKNNLFHLLTNRIYLGKITYKGEAYDGEHPAIVDAEIFDRTQRLLKRNGRTGGANVRNRHGALLKGLVRCVTCDCAMVPSHTMKHLSGKGSKVYRYYCCANAREHGWNSCPAPSVPAPELERFVVDQVKGIGRDAGLLAATLAECRRADRLETADLGLEAEPTDKIMRHAARAYGVARHIPSSLNPQASSLPPEVGEACSLFDPLWETLNAREQSRILHLLIERVDYDGPKGTVAITFHPTGIKTLAEELKGEETTTCKA